MTSILKNMYIDRLEDRMNKYNSTYHRAIKIKPVDVNPITYIDFDEKNDKEVPRLKVSDNVRMSKYMNIFAKGYVPNLSEEVFVIKKVKNNVPWTYVIRDLNEEGIVRKKAKV